MAHRYFEKIKRNEFRYFDNFWSDGQSKIEYMEKVSEHIEQHYADVLIGSQFLDGSKEKISNYRKLKIKIITKIINSSLKKKIMGLQIGFRSHCKNAKI